MTTSKLRTTKSTFPLFSLLGVIILTITSCTDKSEARVPKVALNPDAANFANSVFQQPLIIGASVSADFGTASPGRRASLRHVPPRNIRTIAQPGAPSLTVIPKVSDASLADRSVVIAMDLYFWDSTLFPAHPSLRAMEALLSRTALLNIPVVLGDIPELLPGRQMSRSRLNARIHEICTQDKNCHLLRLDELHRKVLRDGFLETRGRQYPISELVPDGLHLSDPASEHIADLIVALLG